MYFVIALIIFTLNFFAVGVTIGFILLHIGAYPLDLKALFRKQYTRSFLVTLSHKFPLLLYPLNIYILFFNMWICFFQPSFYCCVFTFIRPFIGISTSSSYLMSVRTASLVQSANLNCNCSRFLIY